MTNSSIIMTRGVMKFALFKLMYQQPCYCDQWYCDGSVITHSSIVSWLFKRYKKSCRSYKLSSTHARIMHVSDR